MCAKQRELHHNDVIIVIAAPSTCTVVRDGNPGFGHSELWKVWYAAIMFLNKSGHQYTDCA